jgi:hypothetical protein
VVGGFGIFFFRHVDIDQFHARSSTGPSPSWGIEAPDRGGIPLNEHAVFSSRLVLPLACERLDSTPSGELREAVERSNDGIICFLLQGVDLEAMSRPADERLAEVLAPLRIKLDMIIEMLGRLSYRDIGLPPVSEIELGIDRIAWRSARAWQLGDWLGIKLYFHPIFREPIVFFGKVTGCAGNPGNGGLWVEAELAEMSESTGEGIARLALLTQRRQRGRLPAQPSLRRRK